MTPVLLMERAKASRKLLADAGVLVVEGPISTVTPAAEEVSEQTGAMVALVPSAADAERLAVAGGEPAEELHVTLMYLGTAADIPADTQHAIIEALRSTVEDALRPDYDLPLAAEGFAVSVFNPGDSNDRETCVVLGLSGDDLDAVHGLVATTVRDVQRETGFVLPEQHSPWLPHVTLQYTDDAGRVEELTDRVGPITFDRLRVAFGWQVTDIPLVPVTSPGLFALARASRHVQARLEALVAGVVEPVFDISRMPPQLRKYWLSHEVWAAPGAFTKCTEDLRAHGVPGHMVDGACANLHHEATGVWPGHHGGKRKRARGSTAGRVSNRDYVRDPDGQFADVPNIPNLDLNIDEGDETDSAPAFELLDTVKVGRGSNRYYLAAFTDHDGEIGGVAGGRVVAISDNTGDYRPNWNSGHPWNETNLVLTPATTVAVADAMDSFAAKLGPLNGKADMSWEEGPVRVGVVTVDGYKVAAFHDPAGDIGAEGRTFVSVSNSPSTADPSWDDDDASDFDGLDVAAVTAAMRRLAGHPVSNHASRSARLRGRAVVPVLAARVLAHRVRLNRFDPSQVRDPDGKWTAFGGVAAFAKEHLFGDGTVSTSVGRDGIHLDLANRTGGTNKSGGLGRDQGWELGDLLEGAADWNPDEDGYPREGDVPEMVANSVHTFTGGPDDPATGFAQVSHDGTGNIVLELRSSDDKLQLSRSEAKALAETVQRATGASRVEAKSGLVDVYPTDDHKIGLRLTAADGSVVEPAFDAESWTRLRRAIDVVWEGFDESNDFGLGDDGTLADDEDLPEVDDLEIDTNAGRMYVYREGPVPSLDDPNYGSGALSFGPPDDSWRVDFPSHHEHPMFDAFQAVELYAAHEEWRGFENKAPRLVAAASVGASVGKWVPQRVWASLRAGFVESAVRRDRKGLRGKFDPSQVRDPHTGEWISTGAALHAVEGALEGLDVHDEKQYADMFGDIVDEANVEFNPREYLTARFFHDGHAHVALDLEGGQAQVLGDIDAENMRKLADDIENVAQTDPDVDEPDADGIVVEETGWSSHDFYVGLYDTGDVRLYGPDGGKESYMDLSNDQALEFAEALRETADSWDREFEHAEEPVRNRLPADVLRDAEISNETELEDSP